MYDENLENALYAASCRKRDYDELLRQLNEPQTPWINLEVTPPTETGNYLVVITPTANSNAFSVNIAHFDITTNLWKPYTEFPDPQIFFWMPLPDIPYHYFQYHSALCEWYKLGEKNSSEPLTATWEIYYYQYFCGFNSHGLKIVEPRKRVQCSRCRYKLTPFFGVNAPLKFCPNCHAKMSNYNDKTLMFEKEHDKK